MRFISPLLIAATLTTVASAQDVIYYPFLTGSGTTVTNLGTAGSGTLSTGNTTNSGWTTGKTNSALAGMDATGSTGSWVSSGWGDAISGSFTVAMFMRESLNVANGLSYQFSGRGSFRMFTGGVAYEGLFCRAWGGTPADLVLPGTTNSTAGNPFFDLRSATAGGNWVHVALVVDATAMVATWYVNGSEFHNIPITAAANIAAGSDFLVGMHTGATNRSNQDLDDFRFSTRAVPAHEIQAWAMAKMIADKSEVSLSGQGSQTMNIDTGNASQLDQYLVVGSITGTWAPTVLGGVAIPLVADPFTDLTLAFQNTPVFLGYRGILVNGKASASFNIPANAPSSAVGAKLYHSAIIFQTNGTILDATNAVPVTITQ